MTFASLPKVKFIELDPPTSLQFDDIPKKSSIAYLKIRNIYSTNVIFKIKTTAPRSYIVRPNQVILGPEETIEVQFYMNPTETYPSVLNSKDRFMITATDVGDDPHDNNRTTVWTEKPSSSIQQVKLNALFKRVENNNTSIILEQKSFSKSNTPAQKLINTPKSHISRDHVNSGEPSFDNLDVVENKQLTFSIKSSDNFVSPQYKDLKRSEKNPVKESPKETFKDLDKESVRGSFKELAKDKNKGTWESLKESSFSQFNQYSSPKQPVQFNQNIMNTQQTQSNQYNKTNNNNLYGGVNVSKSYSEPLNETELGGFDYKKEYEKLLSKVEDQEKQLIKIVEERNHVFQELNLLKENLGKRKATPKSLNSADANGGFQLFHVILVAIISLLLGAIFSV